MLHELPIPDLIEHVDFRVTFTINGAPYTPAKVDVEIEKMKLPDLPQIPLPKLSNLSDPRMTNPADPRADPRGDPRGDAPRGDPRDPRRRLSQSTYPVNQAISSDLTIQMPLWSTPTGLAANGGQSTPTRKKISISEYLKKSEKTEPNTVKPILQPNAVLPVIYGPEVWNRDRVVVHTHTLFTRILSHAPPSDREKWIWSDIYRLPDHTYPCTNKTNNLLYDPSLKLMTVFCNYFYFLTLLLEHYNNNNTIYYPPLFRFRFRFCLPYYRAGAIRSKKSILFLSSLIGGNSCCVWIIASVQLIESMTDKRAIISANEWAEKK